VNRLPHLAVVTIGLLATACGSDGPWVRAVDRSVTVTSTAPAPTTIDAQQLDAYSLIEALASDAMGGRDNQSQGSLDAQALIVGQLEQFAQPALRDGYLQPFALGSNIVGVIPGGDLADEYVIIGAHYDHVGSNCVSDDPADQICNGATDNASGVATVISIARAIAAEGTPRRSVLIALWDAEEDGLLGSAAYVANPVIPLSQTVVYLNFDIQGATVLPSLANLTIAIGAESGGQALAQAATEAMAASTLRPVLLNSFLFEGRSDHSNFAQRGVPAMLFTDAAGGCYHTAQDDIDIVDFAKLAQQVELGSALVRELVAADASPQNDPAAPNLVFADAVALLNVAELSETDLALLSPAAAAQVQQFSEDLRAIVGRGADAFDGATAATVLSGVDQFLESLTESTCASFTA